MYRSRVSRGSRTYYDVERNGSSDYQNTAVSRDSSSGLAKHHDEVSPQVPPLPTDNLGANHGIYEAKQNGLPETKTGAYRSGAGPENRDDSNTTLDIPLEGIRIQHDVTVEKDAHTTQ